MVSKPRCFVALAVGPDDTEAYYDRLVKPVLDRNGITPVVISRRESNDDLNNQIIEQLGKCDVCIADLTYARPSVYFEAGYAQHKIPVIYTVRQDHLGRNQPDSERVHFDLAMKPLIKWSNPSDPQFRKRLEKRLRGTFLKDWRHQREGDEQRERDRRTFSGWPLKERLARLRGHTIHALRERGYRSWAVLRPAHGLLPPKSLRDLARSTYALRAIRRHRGRLIMVIVQAFHNPTKTELDQLAGLTSGWALRYESEDSKVPPRDGAVHSFLFSLQPVTPARLDVVLPTYSSGQRPGHYSKRDSIPLTGGNTLPVVAILDCISDIKSETEFRSELQGRVSHLGEP